MIRCWSLSDSLQALNNFFPHISGYVEPQEVLIPVVPILSRVPDSDQFDPLKPNTDAGSSSKAFGKRKMLLSPQLPPAKVKKVVNRKPKGIRVQEYVQDLHLISASSAGTQPARGGFTMRRSCR
jgi:hypothetical protein